MSGSAPVGEAELEQAVLAVVRGLARELHGPRGEQLAEAGTSLERELGFGSLERVELLSRLEQGVGRRLDERFLRLDSARELSRALASAPPSGEGGPARDPQVLPEARAAGRVETIHGSLRARAESDPDRPHVFMREDDGREHTITYGVLHEAACRLAGGLRARGVKPGDTVALMLPTGFDFLRTFQGILVAGAIPVPIYPPVRLDRLEEYALRQGAILADAGITALVTIARARPIAARLATRVPSLRGVVTPDELAAEGESWPATGGRGSDPAFIQYTSGSTGSPKGVLLTHDNLLANIRAITGGLQATPADVGVSWLPLYHDMGLIGSWLFCMHQGYPLDVMSPLAFLARPERWLWAIHRRRGTLSAAPNFAYELCARKIPDHALEGLDLSSWRCALNGAEPVLPETLARFAQRFAPYGFRPTSMFPVYGLAENSVAVAFPPPGRGPRVLALRRGPFETERRVELAAEGDLLRLVSAGSAVPGHEVRVVDEQGAPLPEGRVGRIAFRGPSMTAGYFGKPEATAAISLPDGFLDSGDLGFLHEGELYVAGRAKDLVIKGGRNLVPQEIEEVAADVPGVRRGCVAVFGVPLPETGTEALVVVAETRATAVEERQRIEVEVVQRVNEAVGVPPDTVCLVPPGAVPKTSSGKIRRSACRELYVSGELGRPTRGGRPWRLLLSAARSETAARLRPVPRAAYGAWLASAAAVGLPPLVVAARLTPSGRPLRGLGRAAARVSLATAGMRWRREGEPLPERPVVMVANHASYVDVPLLMAALERDFVFVAKSEILGWPVVGSLVRRTGQLTVDRFDVQRGLDDWQATVDLLRQGRRVLFFPEGTFTAAAGLRPFRLGAFNAAIEAGVEVVPVALQGTRGALRSGEALPRPRALTVWVGTPLAPRGEGWRAAVDLRDRAAEQIAARCGEPRLDLIAALPERPE